MDALDDAPVHARRALFSTLIDSLGEESLAIMSAVLLRRAVSPSLLCGGDAGGSGDEGEEKTTALVEFVHQTVHCSGAEAQVSQRTVTSHFCVDNIALKDVITEHPPGSFYCK